MKKPLRMLPPECASIPRRTAVRRVGGWVLYFGTVAAAACGRTPLGDPIGGSLIGDDDDDDDDDGGTTVTTVPTTPVEPCTCDPVSGAPLGLNVSAFTTTNMFAVNTNLDVFICRDAAGFYAMSDLCVHGQHMTANGSTYNTDNLSGGFRCSHQGSRFDGNGLPVSGPCLGSDGVAGTPDDFILQHYLLTIDAAGELYIDLAKLVDPTCRCNPA